MSTKRKVTQRAVNENVLSAMEGLPLSFARFHLANHARAPGFVNKLGKKFKSFTPLELCGAAAGELGEMANNVKKVRRGDYSLAEMRPKIGAEIADTLTYLFLIANKLDIDLDVATRAKFNEVSDRVNSSVRL